MPGAGHRMSLPCGSGAGPGKTSGPLSGHWAEDLSPCGAGQEKFWRENDRMKKVMFLCTANSCRSQMAEGLMRNLGRGRVEVHSAGLFAAGVHPRAVAVMKEIGLDISAQRSKDIDPGLLNEMDYAITLCGHAESSCPATPPGVTRLHWPIEDPVRAVGTEEEIMEDFRRARDEIRRRVEKFLRDEGMAD